MSDIVQQKTGVQPNRKCYQCKITAKESYELGPADTGIEHPEYSKFRIREYTGGDFIHIFINAYLISMIGLQMGGHK